MVASTISRSLLSSFVFGVAGLLLAYRFASIAAPPREALWSALAMAGASPLLYYLYLAPSYSHALTVFTSGAFFLYWWRTRHADRAATWFRWGLLDRALFLVHWNDVVLATARCSLSRRSGCSGAAGPGRAGPGCGTCSRAPVPRGSASSWWHRPSSASGSTSTAGPG